MSKIKRVIAGLGVAAGFGVAILPVAAFADDDPETTPETSGETVITANVNDVISLRLVSSGSAGDKTLICSSSANP